MNSPATVDRAARWGWPILEDAAARLSFKSERAIARKMLAGHQRADVTRLLANLAKGIPAPFHRHIFLLDGILVPMGLATRREVDGTLNAVSPIESLENDISAKLREVAELIELRDALAADRGVTINSAGTPSDWMKAGLAHSDPQTRMLAEEHTLPAVEALDQRFDWKYWPDLPEVLQGLANSFTDTPPEPTHPDVAAAAEGNRSPRQFLRILWHGQFRQIGRHLPMRSETDPATAPLNAFRLDDTDMATLLRLVAEPIEYTPDTVKKARHYLRDQAEADDLAWSRFLSALPRCNS